MIINKQIVLNLLFENYRSTHVLMYVNEVTKDAPITHNGVNLTLPDLMSNIYTILGLEVNPDNFRDYYDPFFDIVMLELNSKQQIMVELEKYYNWLVSKPTF